MSYLAKTPEDLLPCPHCGGEAKEFTGEDAAPHRWTVECDSCGAHVGSDTRHKARAKWNRRAERTCRPVVADDGAGAWGVCCSKCGYRFAGPYGKREVPEHMAGRRDIMPCYCPSCGSRVEVNE